MLENIRYRFGSVTCTESDSSDYVPWVGCSEHLVKRVLLQNALELTGVLGIDRLQTVQKSDIGQHCHVVCLTPRCEPGFI